MLDAFRNQIRVSEESREIVRAEGHYWLSAGSSPGLEIRITGQINLPIVQAFALMADIRKAIEGEIFRRYQK